MKTIKLTFTFAIILMAGIAFAQFPQSSSPDSCSYVEEDLRAAIFEGNPDFVHVKVAKKLGDKVKIRVKDENKTLYAQNYKKYARVNVQYDIREFPEGSYTFEILQGKEVVYSKVIEKKNSEALSQR
jgi:hypothetical protein